MRGRKGCSQARGCSEKVNLVVKFFYKVKDNTEFVTFESSLSNFALHLLNYPIPFCVTPFPHLLHYSIQNGDVGWVLHRMGLKKEMGFKVRKALKLELVLEDLLKRLIFIVQNSLRPNLDNPASRFWCQNLKSLST